MVREVERKQEQESRNQEPSLQDPAQQRCQGGGGGLEEKAVFTVRAAAYFSTHEKAGTGCVFIVLRCRMQRQKSMQIIFFWHSADEKKKKGKLLNSNLRREKAESLIQTSTAGIHFFSQQTQVWKTNVIVFVFLQLN